MHRRPNRRLLCHKPRRPHRNPRHHLRHRFPNLLLPHPQFRERVLDRAARDGLRTPLQRFRGQWRGNALYNHLLTERIRLLNHPPRRRRRPRHPNRSPPPLFETTSPNLKLHNRRGNELVLSLHPSILDILILKHPLRPCLFLPFPLSPLVRNFPLPPPLKRRPPPGPSLYRPSPRPVYLWLPLRPITPD